MIKRFSALAVPAGLVLLAACGGRTINPAAAGPTPISLGGDSLQVDTLWAQARKAYRSGKWNKAATELERLLLEYPAGDSRIDETHFMLAECYFAQKDHIRAAREFRRVSDETPNSTLAPLALERAGDVYADLWRRPELDPTYAQTALATYREVLNRYPGTEAANRATDRIADLDNEFAEKELKNADFYLRLKAYDSAIIYLKDLVASYPRARVAPLALIKLVRAYQALGYAEDVQETCGYIRRFHPNAQGVGEVCPAPAAASS